MELHEIKKTVLPNGTIVLDNLPFEAGDKVKVTITKSEESTEFDRYPLRGTAYSYEDPFSSLISLDDWNGVK